MRRGLKRKLLRASSAYWPYALYAVALLALYHQTLLPGDARRLFGWDYVNEYWQDIVFPVRAIRAGEAPWWNPFSLLGYSFEAAPQTGLFSPVSWALWAVSWLTGHEGPWLAQAKAFVHMWIGAAGMHRFLMKRTGSLTAALVGGLAWPLGALTVSFKDSAGLWPLMFLPWVAHALVRFVEGPELRRAALLALTLGLMGAAGSPAFLFHALATVAFFWVAHTFVPLGGSLSRLRAQAPWLVGVVLLQLMLLAVTVEPTMAWTEQSFRAVRTAEYALTRSMPTKALRELLWPNLSPAYTFTLYVGALVPVALVAGFFRTDNPDERARRWVLAAFAALAFALASGKFTPVLPFLVKHVPGFGLFREPFRYKFELGFIALTVAGECIAFLLRKRSEPAVRRSAALSAGAWLLVGALLLWVFDLASTGTPWAVAAGAGSVICFVAALYLPRHHRPLVAASLALFACDLALADQPIVNIDPKAPRHERSMAQLESLPGLATHHYRFHDPHYRNLGPLLDLRDFGGYPIPLRAQRWIDVDTVIKRQPLALRHFNVRWLMSSRSDTVHELSKPAPLGQIFYAARTSPSGKMLARLENPRPLRRALLSPSFHRELPVPSRTPLAPEAAELVSYGRSRIVLRAEAKQPAVLVLNELHYDGWTAEVNGEPAEIFEANYLLRAIAIPAGRSTVVFRYEPERRAWLLALWVVAVLLIMLGLAWPSIRRMRLRTERADGPPPGGKGDGPPRVAAS